jgi:osmotically-inducible protein OsmY
LSDFGAFDWLSFQLEADSGTVILTGFASGATLSSAAEQSVLLVEGVRSVENRIERLPTSTTDDRIRLRAYGAIYTHPSLQRYVPAGGSAAGGNRGTGRLAQDGVTAVPGPHPVHIIVKDGNVILLGVVDTESHAQIAETQVRSLAGVFSVNNKLGVRGR